MTAPAQVAVENQVKSFTAGREHKTIYQGLSDDVDRAWGELYNRRLLRPSFLVEMLCSSFRIIVRHDNEDTKKWGGSLTEQDISNQTWTGILSGWTWCFSPASLPCRFLFLLCPTGPLNRTPSQNNVRRALHKEYYINDTDLDEDHVSHCIDTIRQSLM